MTDQEREAPRGWIGVDLDGTLAQYDGWKGPTHIGAPVPAMLERVRAWLEAGHEVRIFTARISTTNDGERKDIRAAIGAWCTEHGLLYKGRPLFATCVKDFGMLELWDDRAVQVIANTGEPVGASTRGLT